MSARKPTLRVRLNPGANEEHIEPIEKEATDDKRQGLSEESLQELYSVVWTGRHSLPCTGTKPTDFEKMLAQATYAKGREDQRKEDAEIASTWETSVWDKHGQPQAEIAAMCNDVSKNIAEAIERGEEGE